MFITTLSQRIPIGRINCAHKVTDCMHLFIISGPYFFLSALTEKKSLSDEVITKVLLTKKVLNP